MTTDENSEKPDVWWIPGQEYLVTQDYSVGEDFKGIPVKKGDVVTMIKEGSDGFIICKNQSGDKDSIPIHVLFPVRSYHHPPMVIEYECSRGGKDGKAKSKNDKNGASTFSLRGLIKGGLKYITP